MDIEDEIEDDILLGRITLAVALIPFVNDRNDPVPCRNSVLTGQRYYDDLMDVNSCNERRF